MARRWSGAVVGLAVLVATAPGALAEPALPPRVLDVPTAWLQERGAGHGTAGQDHRGGGTVLATFGLAGLADLELGAGDRVLGCAPCDGLERATESTRLLAAALKIGWQPPLKLLPAVALGFRRSIAVVRAGSARKVEVSELFAVASMRRGSLGAHLGAAAWATSHDDGMGGDTIRLGTSSIKARPFAGLEWQPVRYPRTTVLGDLSYAPELGNDRTQLRWRGAWGVRYQALAWGSIELAVRHHQGEGIDGSTVMVRVNGVLGARDR